MRLMRQMFLADARPTLSRLLFARLFLFDERFWQPDGVMMRLLAQNSKAGLLRPW